jgi:hypothetical protein
VLNCAGSKNLFAATVLALLTACGSTQPVRFTVHSDPPGGYVVMQIKGPHAEDPDWVYLGNTPLVTVRQLDLGEIESARSVALRVMKEGYFDQGKEWAGKPFVKETEEKGGVFWNPKLVPVTGK